MTVNLTSEVHAAVLALASRHHPREACGLLFGSDTAITAHCPAANVHPAPETHFEIDPQALVDAYRAMRAGGPRLIGYYHSHPRGPACPSDTDSEMAARDGMVWAIVGGGELRLFRDGDNGFAALSYTLV